ncbi:MAG: aminotransferase class I/II-fold pyridoxal phosphate-dependent enzyme [Fimbriimonadaceae bacterium]|jgi:threonine aldolase|nr:aminotransferase class I/II-fold pyridoxal phosphate-dependent enzyme [Fimbriimonadaceae bacterium]
MKIDLRSDTVTKPTQAMKDAMMKAELGDDVLGDEPTVQALESLACQLTGKEAAVFVPSGTMGNQIAIAAYTQPGDSVLVEDEAHILYYECGAPAVLNGVTLRSVPSQRGVIDPEILPKRCLTRSDHTPGTTLLCLENTHNRAGGVVTNQEHMMAYRDFADAKGISIHLDGARAFHAAIAQGLTIREVLNPVDSASLCLSKGLCAPVGSVLVGSGELISAARRWRKRLGGGMRQSGILAAAGIVALETMIDRLADDHALCRWFGEELSKLPGLTPSTPETNILMVQTQAPASLWQEALCQHDLHCFEIDPYRLRFVFHNDVSCGQTERAVEIVTHVSQTLATASA